MRIVNVGTYGSLWLREYHCDAIPRSAAVTEEHGAFSLSFVRRGSFGCRALGSHHELVPGSVFVGHAGDEFTCTHDHRAGGDECLSFQFSHECVDGFPGASNAFRVVSLEPHPEHALYAELARASSSGQSDLGLDEIALGLLDHFVRRTRGAVTGKLRPSPRDRRRIVEAALWLEERAADALSLDDVAAMAELSAFHFLRLFRRVLGVTPHQYLIRTRLRRALRLLAESERSVTHVALDVGFADLSNFVRTFHRTTGLSPSGYRKALRRESKIFQERWRTQPLR